MLDTTTDPNDGVFFARLILSSSLFLNIRNRSFIGPGNTGAYTKYTEPGDVDVVGGGEKHHNILIKNDIY